MSKQVATNFSDTMNARWFLKIETVLKRQKELIKKQDDRISKLELRVSRLKQQLRTGASRINELEAKIEDTESEKMFQDYWNYVSRNSTPTLGNRALLIMDSGILDNSNTLSEEMRSSGSVDARGELPVVRLEPNGFASGDTSNDSDSSNTFVDLTATGQLEPQHKRKRCFEKMDMESTGEVPQKQAILWSQEVKSEQESPQTSVKSSKKTGKQLVYNTCFMCCKTFSRVKRLAQHMEKAHGDTFSERSSACEGSTTTTSCSSYEASVNRNSGASIDRDIENLDCMNNLSESDENPCEVPYACSECSDTFSNRTSLEAHMMSHNNKSEILNHVDAPQPNFPDEENSINLTSLPNLADADSPKATPPKLKTENVSKDSNAVSEQGLGNRGSSSSTDSAPYKCHFCEMTYQLHHNYIRHLQMKHRCRQPPNSSFACAFCEEQCKSWADFKHHVLKSHSDIVNGIPIRQLPASRGSTPGRKYQCRICFREIIEKPNLVEHVFQFHAWKKPFCCSYCDRSFITSPLLERHCKDQHRVRPKKKINL